MDALLRGEDLPWSAVGADPDEFVETCAREDVSALVYQRLAGSRYVDDWPEPVRRELARTAHACAAAELVRRQAIVAALDALAAADVQPILFKGAPLAYTVYGNPSLRPRRDTDLLVPRDQAETVRRVMREIGYREALASQGDLVLCQFEMAKRDRLGLDHAFDFHWKVSMQTAFADVLTYEEMETDARPVPALGPHARAAAALHALLIACVHPVMHHRNVERTIWVYDIHLLASSLPPPELDRFVELATEKGVAVVCARQLDLARRRLGTNVPEEVIARLARTPRTERSAVYLEPGRRWHHELASNLRHLPRWRDRLRLLQEVLLPEPAYMMRAYHLSRSRFFTLPALYVHRGLSGSWKILRGRK
jgi:hypothetical protein